MPGQACELGSSVDCALLQSGNRQAPLEQIGDDIPYALETDWPVGAAGFEPLHFESDPLVSVIP